MASEKITYTDKTNTKPITDRTKQATAEDFNEIKSAINTNGDIVDALAPGDLAGVTETVDEVQFTKGIYAPVLRTDPATLELGPQLSLEDAAASLVIRKKFNTAETTVPLTISFDPTGNTTDAFTSEFLVKETDFIFQPDFSGTMNASEYTIVHASTSNAFVTKYIFKVGATVPANLTLKVYRNNETVDELLVEQDFEGTILPNTDLEFDLEVPAGFFLGENSIIKLISDTAFDLDADVSNTTPYWGVDRQRAIFYSLIDERDYTASDVKGKLEGLTGTDRLDATAIQRRTIHCNAYILPTYTMSTSSSYAKVNASFLDSAVEMTLADAKITSNHDGTKNCLINVSMGLQFTNNNVNFETALYKNGAIITDSIMECEFDNASQELCVSLNTIVEMEENDYIELYAKTDSNQTAQFRRIQISVLGV